MGTAPMRSDQPTSGTHRPERPGRWRPAHRLAGLGLAVGLALSACGGDGAGSDAVDASSGDDGAEAVAADVGVDGAVDAMPDALASVADSAGLAAAVEQAAEAGVVDEQVLEAALIVLADGDLDAALASGLVTEADVDAALAAIEAGTIGDLLD